MNAWRLAGLAIAAVALPTLVKASTLFGPYTIPSEAMAPNIVGGDFVYADPSFGQVDEWQSTPLEEMVGYEPERGAVLVFLTPEGYDYVMRLVGMPGETISMRSGVLHIDRVPVELVDTDAVYPTRGPQGTTNAVVQRETLPNGGSYRVLDTVENGPGDDVPPIEVPDGHYFFLGDNRDNSNDSRFGLGPVPRAALKSQIHSVLMNTEGKPTVGRDL